MSPNSVISTGARSAQWRDPRIGLCTCRCLCLRPSPPQTPSSRPKAAHFAAAVERPPHWLCRCLFFANPPIRAPALQRRAQMCFICLLYTSLPPRPSNDAQPPSKVSPRGPRSPNPPPMPDNGTLTHAASYPTNPNQYSNPSTIAPSACLLYTSRCV